MICLLDPLVRRSVKEGAALPEEITATHLADEGLLKPVLEDDALIFCLDELPAPPPPQGPGAGAVGEEGKEAEGKPQVDELLRKNARLQAELEQLAKQFANYRLAVEQTLDKRWGVDEESDKGGSSSAQAAAAGAAGVSAPEDGKVGEKGKDDSAYYFESYAHNGKLCCPSTGWYYRYI